MDLAQNLELNVQAALDRVRRARIVAVVLATGMLLPIASAVLLGCSSSTEWSCRRCWTQLNTFHIKVFTTDKAQLTSCNDITVTAHHKYGTSLDIGGLTFLTAVYATSFPANCMPQEAHLSRLLRSSPAQPTPSRPARGGPAPQERPGWALPHWGRPGLHTSRNRLAQAFVCSIKNYH